MATPLDLTIAIPVLNEASNIEKCIKAIGSKFAKKIIVIDSGSKDSTGEIAKNCGAEVISFFWDGKFPKKRNWFLRNYKIDTKWILFLDADELLTEKFKNELHSKLPNEEICGYWLSYSIHFLGKRLIGGYPLRKLALFRVGAGEYEKIDENNWSHLDMEVHEHPIIKGKTGYIKSKIDHLDFQGISHYIQKQNEYSKWEALRYINLDPNHYNIMTFNQKIKYKLLNSIWIGPAFFLGSYIFMGGFLDGSKGLLFAIFKTSYFSQVHLRIKELTKSKKQATNKTAKKQKVFVI